MRFVGGLGLVCAVSLVAACGDDSAPSGDGTDAGTGSTGDVATATSMSGSDSDASTGPVPSEFCEGETQLRYDPASGALDALPDDVFTVDDDGASGVRLDIRTGENVILEGIATRFQTAFDQANTLDGFGTTAGFMFQVSAPLDPESLPPSGQSEASASDSIVLVNFDASPPEFVPFEWELVPEREGMPRTTVLLTPMVPLAAATRYGVAVTTAVADDNGGCIAPSAPMLALLQGEAEAPVDRVQGRVDELLEVLSEERTIGAAQDLSAAFVYTTQTTIDEAVAIAEELRASDPPTYEPLDTPCTGDPDTDLFLTCYGRFDAIDYTGEDEAVDEDVQAAGSYSIPVVSYVPTAGEGPYPILVYGHGLAGDRFQAAELAELAVPAGVAVIAIDAPKHGDHPDRGGIDVVEFFGLSLNFDDPLDALKLRDNFRQGAFDRLQLVELLLDGLDVTDDGETDFDPENLHYLGVSLGGIMGPQLVAFVPEFQTAIFIVPGARVSGIVRDGEAFAQFIDIFASGASDGEFVRFFPLLQSLIDRGDSGIYAPHVLAGRRLPGFDEAAPQVLMQMVIGDDTVPNVSNAFFARALGAPHVGKELLHVGVIEHIANLPVSANVDGHTAGMFQFDETGDGQQATHGNVARSVAGQAQTLHFIETQLAGEPAEILDPY